MSQVTTLKSPMQDELPSDQICEIRLIGLKLENFKGIKHFDLQSRGGDISVRGDNASGKTSLADGFSWLLFGKDSQDHADFEIKTLSPTGEALHGLEHSVEAALSIDGHLLELRKVYKERWSKKRGSAEKEFTGHTKECAINGVPVTQSEYESQVASLVTTEEISKLLTNPVHFAERLHWQDRRKKLLEVCGDISDADVIASSRDLTDLPEILAGRSIDDHRKIAMSRKRKINEELQRIPVRVDEASRALPDIETNGNSLKAQLNALRESRAEVETERTRIQSGGEIAEKTKRIREIESELIEERNRQKAIAGESVGELRARHSEIEAERRLAQDIILRGEQAIQRAEGQTVSLAKLMDSRRKDWHELNSQKFSPKVGDDVCAACGQKLPGDQVEESRQKAEANFNADKARRLKRIAEEGKDFQADHAQAKAEIEERQKTIEQNKKDADESQRKLGEIKRQIAEHEDKSIMVSAKESKLVAAKADLETQIVELREGNKRVLIAVEQRLDSMSAEIIEIETKLSRISQRREGEERITQLKADQRRLAAEYEELESQLYLLDEFTRRKVSMLTDRINSRFELARFKLFDIQVNGAIAECCEVTYEGVPWTSLNTGAQVNIGLDMIRTFSEHYGISPPIFIDHSESVTQLLETPGQQIRLIVSDAYQELHVEEVR